MIVHEAKPASMASISPPALCDNLTPISDKGRETIEARIATALGSESHSVEMTVDEVGEGSAFLYCAKALAAPDNQFVGFSQSLASKLTRSQTSGSVKSGIAVVITGTVGTVASPRRFIAIVKADSDEGFAKVANGKDFELTFIEEMVLGTNNKLYKIGCFIEKFESDPGDDPNPSNFDALVFDHLLNQSSGNVALYFYKTFLGCELAHTAKRLTKEFHEHSSRFIDALEVPQEDKVDLKNSLSAYLRSNRRTCSVKDFAADFLDPKVRSAYEKHMGGSGVPLRDIAKDTTLIKSKLRTRRLKFSNNVRITGPSDGFEKYVQVVGLDGDWTMVKVLGQLETQS